MQETVWKKKMAAVSVSDIAVSLQGRDNHIQVGGLFIMIFMILIIIVVLLILLPKRPKSERRAPYETEGRRVHAVRSAHFKYE